MAQLLASGLSRAEAARRSGVPRATLRSWIPPGINTVIARREESTHCDGACERVRRVPRAEYAYLLGLYLGDGCLTCHRRNTYRLRIALDVRYPSIIEECESAMAGVLPNKVGRVACPGCVSVNAYSKHWPCLFPQHAPGPKHMRPIVLEPWQERIGLEEHPRLLLRGLIHSDGYRGTNRIKAGVYSYPRYMFSNRSADIRDIFTAACHRIGIHPTQCGGWQLSVARRNDVALMDSFIGPKQ